MTKYLDWLQSALGGALGFSSFRNMSVAQVIRERLPATLQLMSLAFVTSLIAGIALGTWQGFRSGTKAERVSSTITMTVFSIPEFWLAIILLWVFALNMHWFPTQGMNDVTGHTSTFAAFADRLHHIILPWLSLALIDMAVISRYQRAAMREVLNQQFLRTARAKGVPEQEIMWWHALRVAILPTITIAGLFFPALFVGAVLIERVFGWPGIGSELTSAIESRDYLLVSGIVIVGSAMTALGSFLADTARELADPRLRA